MSTGYFHKGYAKSIIKDAKLVNLTESKGWLLQRDIPNTLFSDVTNCYPLLCCQNWNKIEDDINNLPNKIISVSLVTEPFAEIKKDLSKTFNIFIPFKEHFIVDYRLKISFTTHHQKEISRSIKKGVEIELCINPLSYIDQWHDLYNILINRHNIRKSICFSKSLFINQFKVPGIVVFRAIKDLKTIGMTLWFVSNNNAYYHLAAYSDKGYQTSCSYALMDYALNYFNKKGITQVTLGAGAGLTQDKHDGLSRFKSGWSNYTKKTYFGGKILNLDEYTNIVNTSKSHPSFFPAYRNPND